MGKGRNKRKKRNKKNKTPIVSPEIEKTLPKEKIPRQSEDINAYKKKTPVWQIGRIDHDGKWGWKFIGQKRWEKIILPHLRDREKMTWVEIEQQSGGPKDGSNNHPIPCERLCKDAQKRLEELITEDIDELFSLRVQGEIRIWGIRRERVLQILWFDFEHEVYPV